MENTNKLLTGAALALVASLCFGVLVGRCTRELRAQRVDRTVPGVLAVRSGDGYELVDVREGTEGAMMALYTALLKKPARIHVLTTHQTSPLPTPRPDISLPVTSLKHSLLYTPDDALWDDQWGPRVVGVTKQQPGPSDVIVAVLDSGWNYDFDDQPRIAAAWDAVDEDDYPFPLHWHGTHVASTACAPHNEVGIAGVCPNCWLMPVRVCGRTDCLEFDVVEGVEFALEHGADVINMSFGCTWCRMPYLQFELEKAHEQGIILVASRGNDGMDVPTTPAVWPEVIAVSAIDEDLELAWFSSYGSVDFTSPGVGVVAGCGASDRYCYADGTSMAAPHAAGALAELLVRNPSWGRDEAIAWAQENALDLGEPGYDDLFGWGLIRLPVPEKYVE